MIGFKCEISKNTKTIEIIKNFDFFVFLCINQSNHRPLWAVVAFLPANLVYNKRLAMDFPYPADQRKIQLWATLAGSMIEQTQQLIEVPDDRRTFPKLKAAEITELTGDPDWVWRDYVKSLPDDEKPQTSSGGHYRATLEDVHKYMDFKGTRPKRPDHVKRGIRIAVENFKGGSSKTCLTLHLGIAWARLGLRVLLIDTDPQATLTQLLGIRPHSVQLQDTIANFLTTDDGSVPSSFAAQPTYISGLSIIPSSLALTKLEPAVAMGLNANHTSPMEWEEAFDQVLNQVDKDFDIVLVDFQPAFSMSQAMMLMTMDSLLIPMPTEAADFAGTRDFLIQIASVIEPLEQIRDTPKIWSPTLIVQSRVRKGATFISDLVTNTFGTHRQLAFVDDQPAISAALSTFRSVYEVGSDVYDIRAIKRARDQYQSLAISLLESINERWKFPY